MLKRTKMVTMRGGVDERDFSPREISIAEVRRVSSVPMKKWGHLLSDWPLRDIVALAYCEGLYHGMMMGPRLPEKPPAEPEIGEIWPL